MEEKVDLIDRIDSGNLDPVEDSILLIQSVVDTIVNDDCDNIENLLNDMPIDQLDASEIIELYHMFISTCQEYNRIKCLNIIFNFWNDKEEDIESLPLFSSLFMEPLFTLENLKFMAANIGEEINGKYIGNFSFGEIIDDLIKYTSGGDNVINACERLYNVFGEQTIEMYKRYSEIALEKQNETIYWFLISHLEDINDYASVPSWVHNFLPTLPLESQLVLPETPDVSFNVPDDEKTIELLTEGLDYIGVSIDDIRKAKQGLRELLITLDTKGKIELLKPIFLKKTLSDEQNNYQLFRILGPANPFVDDQISQLKYGGSRMFTGNEYDHDEDDIEYEDWFVGACEACHLRIKYRWHAVRIPRPPGGWVGCYCSMKCLRLGAQDLESTEEATGEPDVLTSKMIDILEENLNRVGIQDRLPNPEPESESEEESEEES